MAKNNKKNAPMVEKTKIEAIAPQEEGLLARLVGMGLIALGFLFIILAIAVILLSRREATVDTSITTPEVNTETLSTNTDTVKVSGIAPSNSNVQFFLDGEELDNLAEVDEDGNFDAEINIGDDDGEFDLEVATVEGLIRKSRSTKSEPYTIVRDTTPPQAELGVDFDAISEDGKVSFTGTTDPDTYVIAIDADGNESKVQADENGKYTLDVNLNAKETNFTLASEDALGNRKISARKDINVEFPDFVEAEVIAQADPEEEAEEETEEIDTEESNESNNDEGDLNGDGVTHSTEEESNDNNDEDENEGDENETEAEMTEEETTQEVAPVAVTTGSTTPVNTEVEDLPEASGELAAAMDVLFAQEAMTLIILASIFIFAGNMAIVYRKL